MSLQRWPLGFDDSPSYAAPLTPWASFPPASTVEGQIRRPAELPQVELIAIGGAWRPRGGRQVLASRFINPVTLAQLTTGRIETLGPFPGGLVRAGMQLRLNWQFQAPAIGATIRRLRASAGSVGHAYDDNKIFVHVTAGTSAAMWSGWADSYLNVLSDGDAAHYGPHLASSGVVSALSNGHATSATNGVSPVVDFSQAWDLALWGTSTTETATNITSCSWSAGVAVFVNPSHTLNTGDTTTVAGVSVGGYNAVYTGITRIDANTWSGTLVADPGGAGTGGTSSRISNMTSKSVELALIG
jgi:hypothetical protein